MKKLKPFIIITMWSCSAFSQNLTPTVQQIKKDTAFCFTVPQAKEIAKHIESCSYKDSINQCLEQENDHLVQVSQKNDSLINKQKSKIYNLWDVVDNQITQLDIRSHQIKTQKKKIKRSKLHKALLGIGLGVATGIAITK